MHRKRNRKGQSMVEYAIGLGCVAAVAMVALSNLGHISGHIVHNVQGAINHGGERPTLPGQLVNTSATPWVMTD